MTTILQITTVITTLILVFLITRLNKYVLSWIEQLRTNQCNLEKRSKELERLEQEKLERIKALWEEIRNDSIISDEEPH